MSWQRCALYGAEEEKPVRKMKATEWQRERVKEGLGKKTFQMNMTVLLTECFL